jgi:hypothetical protein
MCWDGNSGSWREWDKTGKRRHFVYFGGGEPETTDLGSGTEVHSLVYPYYDGFQSLFLGFNLRLEDMSSPGLKPSGQTFSWDLYVHTTPPSMELGPN